MLHLLLLWALFQFAGRGGADAGEGLSSEGSGKALVVDFVAIPSLAAKPEPAALDPARLLQEKNESTASLDTPDPDPVSNVDRMQSEMGDYAPQPTTQAQSKQSVQHDSASSAASGGSPADSLLASYHAALRARIAQSWQTLTEQDFPSDCVLELSQRPGGQVGAASAKTCQLSERDRLQLEAAALMAQPLPYAGYESVFVADMGLQL